MGSLDDVPRAADEDFEQGELAPPEDEAVSIDLRASGGQVEG